MQVIRREEETRVGARRDQWGNWEGVFSDTYYDGRIFRPWIDEGEKQTRRIAWPDGKTFAIFLSHDVDYITRFYRMRDLGLLAKRINGFESVKNFTKKAVGFGYSILRPTRRDPVNDIEEWMNLEESLGFKSTFYFFPEYVKCAHPWDCCYSYKNKVVFFGEKMSVSDVTREIRRRGWEIGLHPSVNAHNNIELLVDQKKQLEEASGGIVNSVRQHYLRYEPNVTPDVHEQAGFKTDSTHGFNRTIGFRSGTAFPYRVWSPSKNRETKVLEISLNIMDVALFSDTSLECDVKDATRRSIEMMDKVQSVGGILGINWHPECRIDPRVKPVYKALLSEAAQRGAWSGTAEQIREVCESQ